MEIYNIEVLYLQIQIILKHRLIYKPPNQLKMIKQQLVGQSSPKHPSAIPKVTFTNQMNYKQRANLLFNKLNSFKTNLQNQKQQQFSEILEQIKTIENNLELTSEQKQESFQRIINSISQIDKQINHQSTEYDRFSKILDNLIQNTNRECQNTFDKMNKENQNTELAIEKYIDFKVESFYLKNKGTWLEQDLLNFEPFKEQLNYLKKQVQEFYKNQSKQVQKLKRQISDTLDKQKQFLLNQIKRTDHEDIRNSLESLQTQISGKIGSMAQKRQNVERSVLSMIQNVINSYMKDAIKFK